jgi:hypothetical protein
MATIDLYIDIREKKLVSGLLDATPKQLPKFVQGDNQSMRIWLLQPVSVSSFTTPYEYVPVAGVTIQAAIGTRVGNSTTYYTQQFSWTASADLASPYFDAIFPMNTAAITTLLGTGGESTAAFFEVKMIVAAVPTTVYSEGCTIQAAVIKDGGISSPPLATPMTVEAAQASFLGYEITGPFTLICATDPTKKISVYVDTAGAFHADPIA